MKPKKPNGFKESKGINSKPKKADNEDDNEDDNDIKKSKRKTFTPPTLEEIKKYVTEKKLQVDFNKFYDYFTEGNWIDSKGNKVKNWKQKILTWNGYSKATKEEKKNYENYEQRQYEDLDKFYINK